MANQIELMKIAIVLVIVAICAAVAWRTMKKIVAEQQKKVTPPAESGAIQCAFCGRPILVNQGVCTHAESSTRPEWTTKDKKGRPLGCLRTDCCPAGGYFIGHWTNDGVDYMFDGRTGMEEAMHTGKVIIVNDMSKRNK